MAAKKGNQFWKARTKHGRDRLFSSPEALWEACCEYFEWVDENPLIEIKAFAYQGEVVKEPIPKMRAMTIAGLCLFLGIERGTWNQWRKVDDFSNVVANADAIIREQKFTGAAADLLNASIISRDLGLAERQSVSVTDVSEDMVARMDEALDPQEAARIYQEMMAGK